MQASAIPIGPPPAPVRGLFARAGLPVSRSRRVCILLAGIVIMSLADLDMTLAYARSVGLIEGNPLARLVMSYGSSWMLALWKVASVSLCVFILFCARGTRYAEIAAWICFMVLVWLSVRWVTYNEQVPGLTSYIADQYSADHRWITLGDESTPATIDYEAAPSIGYTRRVSPHFVFRVLVPALGALAALGGCTSYDPPTLTVASVVVTEHTENGVVLEFTLNAINTNSVALPLREMRYSLDLDGREVFRGYRSPEATLRRYGQQHLKVPVVIALEPGEAVPTGSVKYRLDGTLIYLVPGEMAEVLFEADVRRPKVHFSEKGTLDMGEAAPAAAPPAPAPGPAPAP